jgi:hypothetical protein
MFTKLFNTAYDETYELVKDRCPNGSVDCASVAATLSLAGYASAEVTLYYQKR